MPKTALVTGGAGFIGSHLTENLLNLGFRVRVIDNFVVGSKQNLSSIQNNPSLEVYQLDIVDLESIAPLFCEVDWVFHLAALADVVPSIEKPMEYHHSNVDGTRVLLTPLLA